MVKIHEGWGNLVGKKNEPTVFKVLRDSVELWLLLLLNTVFWMGA